MTTKRAPLVSRVILTEGESFVVASRAYDLMTLDERKTVLEHFARLRQPSVVDRFFFAVLRVVREKQTTSKPAM